MKDALQRQADGTDLHWVIRASGDGEFLGLCGLHGREQFAEPELGIWLRKDAHGRAYGREAIAGIVAWAAVYIESQQLIYPVDRRNVPSRRIPEALGGEIICERKTTAMSGTELDEVVYAIPVVTCRR